MKLLVCMKKFKGGPRVFRQRLVNILKTYPDIEVTSDTMGSFDFELSFLRHQVNHKKLKIIRVDGCYIDGDFETKNKVYKHSIIHSAHAIYQSEFSKKMVEHVLDVHTPSTVIHNGIDLDTIKNIQPDSKIPPGSFVACSLWRKNKRPSSTIRSFLHASTGRDLYMIGDYSGCKEVYAKRRKEPHIHFLGKLSFEQTIAIFKACQYQIHIPYVDSCPNVVVEGLACGLNVICSNLGGTKELVKNDGIVVHTDEWNFDPRQSKISDSSVDFAQVADGINVMIKEKIQRVNRPDLDIRFVADKYINVFRNMKRV